MTACPARLRCPTLRRVIHAVTADPAAPHDGAHDLDSMAQTAHLSTRRFRRLFTEEIGVSPTRWLERVRRDRACQLLVEGHAVTHTATLSGFAQDEQLRRAVSRRLGCTPSQHRGRFTTTSRC